MQRRRQKIQNLPLSLFSSFLYCFPSTSTINYLSLSLRHGILAGSRVPALFSSVHCFCTFVHCRRNRKGGTQSRSGDCAFGFRGTQLCLPHNFGRARLVSRQSSVFSYQSSVVQGLNLIRRPLSKRKHGVMASACRGMSRLAGFGAALLCCWFRGCAAGRKAMFSSAYSRVDQT